MLITESEKKNPEDELYFEMISQERWESEEFFILVLASSQIRIINSCVLSQIT